MREWGKMSIGNKNLNLARFIVVGWHSLTRHAAACTTQIDSQEGEPGQENAMTLAYDQQHLRAAGLIPDVEKFALLNTSLEMSNSRYFKCVLRYGVGKKQVL
jgi:hypothetical protein